MIYFTDRREHAVPLFAEANILPLTFLYYESVSNLIHDINNSDTSINILKLFWKTSNNHSYNTQSSTSDPPRKTFMSKILD